MVNKRQAQGTTPENSPQRSCSGVSGQSRRSAGTGLPDKSLETTDWVAELNDKIEINNMDTEAGMAGLEQPV